MADPEWVAQTTGERISLIRRRRGLSVTDLARQVSAQGVPLSQSLLSRFEHGTRRPTLRLALAIARELDVTPADLGFTVADYPDAEFYRDGATQALLQQMGWPLTSRRHLRVLSSPVG